MASDYAPPPQHHSLQDGMNSDLQQSAYSIPETTVNGDHEPSVSTFEPEGLVKGGDITVNEDHIPSTSDLESEGLVKGGEITEHEDHIPPTDIDTSVPDPIPADAGPSPVEQVDSGIAPLADFIPKEAANTSHPTPPPEEPLITGSAAVDVEMANVVPEAELPLDPVPELSAQSLPLQTEHSLVRPREDDVEEERLAKRTRLDETADVPTSDIVLPDAPVAEEVVETEEIIESEPEPETTLEADLLEPMEPVAAVVTETEVEPIIEPVIEPEPDSAIADQAEEAAALPVVEDVKAEIMEADMPSPDATAEPGKSEDAVATVSETPMVETPVEMAPPSLPQSTGDAPVTQPDKPKYSTEPMTSLQKGSLVEKMKNLKKTKNSIAFLKPVDYVALNIPSYPDIVKHPMDLSTMESKLKEGKYGSVQAFADDFDRIIENARLFNGPAHAVTQAGFAMEAYFRRMMEQVPGPNQQAPAKPDKSSPSIATEKPRRESRAVTQPTATSTTSNTTFALNSDGTPQIRRQSSITDRPARVTKPPPSKEIAYSKPKRKEHLLSLRFCEHILEQLRSTKYQPANSVFLFPVDPVALNIPNYRQVVKEPMDLSTMSQKLKSGQYATAGEFKKDFDLMITNCLTFNPVGNPVRDLGIQFQRNFEELWKEREKWERKNQPASNRASSASADDESVADEEEDEDDDPDGKNATIRTLQKQLAEMQNALSSFSGDKAAKTKKPKSTKSGTKKSVGSMSAVPAKKQTVKPASKPKKAKIVTYEEKQEISEAVGKMDEKQVAKLTEIITENCAKYRNMEEMELEIDDLPNDVQVMLLEYVRKTFGNPNKKKVREISPDDAAALDDDDYEEKGGARGGKRKKHKPMGKQEQQDTINTLKSKLAQFSAPGTSGSESPTASSFNAAHAQADTSGDEESEESEEE